MAKWTVTLRRGKAVRTIRVRATGPGEAAEIAGLRGTVTRVARSETIFGQARRKVLSMSRGERAVFLVRMAGMLRNKVTQLDATRQMAENFGGSIRLASRRAIDHLSTGMNLIDAMEADPYNFPPSTVALLRATARKGDTADALRRVADFEDELRKIGKGNMSFLLKALFGFVFSFAITAYSTYNWAPQVLNNPILKNKGYDFAWMITLGEHSLYVMGGIIGLLVFVAFAATGGRMISPIASDRIVGVVPIYKDVVTAKLNHLSLFRLSILIGSGMMYKEALEACIEDTRPGIMRRDLGRALKNLDRSVSSKPWSHEITALHPTDRASLAMSNNRADTSRTLLVLSEQYAELYRRRMELMGPVVAGIGVLFVVYSGFLVFYQTMWPLMTLLNDMSGK